MISEARTNAEKRVTELPETKTINKTTLAKVLQDWSGFTNPTTGKPSTQPRNLDTAPTAIRPAPVPPEEHHDAADEEDHKQKEATEKAKPTHTQPGSTLVEVEDNADWTPPTPQPVRCLAGCGWAWLSL